jgi:hypothetical protein
MNFNFGNTSKSAGGFTLQSTTSAATSKTSTLKSLLIYKWCAMYGVWRNRKSVSTSLDQFPSVSEPQIFQVLQTEHPFFCVFWWVVTSVTVLVESVTTADSQFLFMSIVCWF